MKLKTKIQLYSSLLMLALVLIVNFSAYYIFYKMSTDNELEGLHVVTKDLVTALNENPSVDPSGLMRAYLPPNGMIRLISSNDVPLVEQTRSQQYLTLPWKYSTSETQDIISPKKEPNIAVIEMPMILGSGEIVTVQVSNYLVSLHETMRTLLYVFGSLSLLVLIPVIFASSILSRFLLIPIQNLIRTMKENMKQGEWKKLASSQRSRDEIYEMQMTFNDMIDHLKATYEKQEMFVSDASHELKTPIHIIKSYAQLLARRREQQLDSGVFEEAISAIDSETDRVNHLIQQLLALAKNQQPSLEKNIHFGNVVQSTVQTFREAYDRPIQFAANQTDIYVSGNQAQLEQIVYILIDNALKYSEDRVDVHLFQTKGTVFFQVRDYGQGIPEQAQARIFDRFYRVDQARSRETGGTGLGLAIAKGIASAHGGTLSVESELSKGTVFTLTIKSVELENE